MRQPIRQFRRILSVAVLPRASNAQAGPTTSNPEWGRIPAFLQRGSPCFFWACHPTATTPLVAHQFSPGARSRFVAIVRTQSHLYRRSFNRRPRDRHRHFILALTRTGPLSIYPCPPAFRQTGDAWLRSHVPCWAPKRWSDHFLAARSVRFGNFSDPSFPQPRLDVSSWLACSRFN